MNKKLGNDFESEFCDLLAEEGFWVHNFAQNAAGQPADVIAVKNGEAHLIDCKVCSHDSFQMSRIESNQSMAMTWWKACGNYSAWFALRLTSGEIYMLDAERLIEYSNCVSGLSEDDIRSIGYSFYDWVTLCE